MAPAVFVVATEIGAAFSLAYSSASQFPTARRGPGQKRRLGFYQHRSGMEGVRVTLLCAIDATMLTESMQRADTTGQQNGNVT
jgi:hypothetical protein